MLRNVGDRLWSFNTYHRNDKSSEARTIKISYGELKVEQY